MRQQCEAKVFFRDGVEQLKVLRLLAALTFKRNHRSSIAAALDVDRVRRRIDIAQRLSAFNFNATGNRIDLS